MSLLVPYLFPIISLLLSLLFPYYIFPYYFPDASRFPIISLFVPHYFPIFSQLSPYFSLFMAYLFPIISLFFPYVFPIISRLCPYLFPIMSLLYISPLFRGSFLHVADPSEICRSIGVLNSSNALGSPPTLFGTHLPLQEDCTGGASLMPGRS